MTILNNAKQDVIFLLGGSITSIPQYFVIGSGSGTTNINSGSLASEEDRQLFTTTSYPAVRKLKWQGDWNSVEMSGLQLTEFGVAKSGAALTGSVYSRTTLPAINFDGTNELRIEATWEAY